METSLPTPFSAGVYVNLPEGRSIFPWIFQCCHGDFPPKIWNSPPPIIRPKLRTARGSTWWTKGGRSSCDVLPRGFYTKVSNIFYNITLNGRNYTGHFFLSTYLLVARFWWQVLHPPVPSPPSHSLSSHLSPWFINTSVHIRVYIYTHTASPKKTEKVKIPIK